MPEVTQLLYTGMFKLARPLSYQPTSDVPDTPCNQWGEEKHCQAARDPGEWEPGRAQVAGRRGTLTSSFCSVFLSSSILCCICFMVCDKAPTPAKSHSLMHISPSLRCKGQQDRPSLGSPYARQKSLLCLLRGLCCHTCVPAALGSSLHVEKLCAHLLLRPVNAQRNHHAPLCTARERPSEAWVKGPGKSPMLASVATARNISVQSVCPSELHLWARSSSRIRRPGQSMWFSSLPLLS